MTPQMMGECGGQRSGGSLLHHRASMSCEGHHFMVATRAQNALQCTSRHVEGGSFFNGHPSYEQGEYAQHQQYFMPGPPTELPMRLAVNTDSDNVRGQHSRGERKRNGSKRLQREQHPRSLPCETGPGADTDGTNEQTGLLPLASQDSETGVLRNGDNKVSELMRLSFNEVRLSRGRAFGAHSACMQRLPGLDPGL